VVGYSEGQIRKVGGSVKWQVYFKKQYDAYLSRHTIEKHPIPDTHIVEETMYLPLFPALTVSHYGVL
jgi:hypothetical protein